MKTCKNCNIDYKDNMKFCPECGTKLEIKKNVCPNCGTEYNDGQKFCSECGTKLDTQQFACFSPEIERFCEKGVEYYNMSEDDNDSAEKEAVRYLTKAAECKHPKASLYLARCYAGGFGVEKDMIKAESLFNVAIPWYKKEAENGNCDAQYELGSCYSFGDGVKADKTKAIEFYSKAADNGSVMASEELGFDYMFGSLGVKDIDKSIEFFAKAADNGSVIASEKLGDLYMKGFYGVKKDVEKAIHYYTIAASYGSVEAQIALGDIIYGRGDYSDAIKMYEKLMRYNDSNRCFLTKIGDCYWNEKEYSKAVIYYEKGEEKKEPLAFQKLAFCYLFGIGKPHDYKKAYQYFKRCTESDYYLKIYYDNNGNIREYISGFDFENLMGHRLECLMKKYEENAEKGNYKDQYELAKCYYFGNGTTKNEKEASKWFKKAAKYYIKQAEKGDRMSQFILGDCICFGEKSEEIRGKSHYWYKQAAEAGLPEAQLALGYCYLKGIGSKVHITKAVRWIEKASDAGNIEAKYTLGNIYRDHGQELGIKDVFNVFFRLHECAAKAGHPKAQHILGEYYYRGYWVKKDPILAYSWHKKSYENGNFESWYYLKKLREEYPNIIQECEHDTKRKHTSAEGIVINPTDNSAIDKCIPNVYFIQAEGFDLTYPDGKRQQVKCGEKSGIPSWSGTGFLLSDGRFVTARHVIESWAFPTSGGETDKNMLALNILANNGGKVIAKFIAISSNGTQLQFSSDQFTINHRNDKISMTEKGDKLIVASIDYTDYAYFYSKRNSGLQYNNEASINLAIRTELVVLGFPLGIGANSATDINPIYGSGIVAKKGLQNGVILTTDTNYEQGNSGGPVFKANERGNLEVVGLVSAGAGRSMGFIVPIAAVK